LERLIFAEQPDPQAWFASVLGQQSLQPKISFLEQLAAMRPLAGAFVVLAVSVAFVMIVPIATRLAVVLTITVRFRFNVAAMTVAIIFRRLACLVAQNGGAKHYASHGNCSDGDQLLFADVQFFCVDFHIHS